MTPRRTTTPDKISPSPNIYTSNVSNLRCSIEAPVKFKPQLIIDSYTAGNGKAAQCYSKLQCITCMDFYKNVSPEELRFDEYNRQCSNRRCSTAAPVKFKPQLIIDSYTVGNGKAQQCFSKLQCIMCMDFYKNISLEELRFDEYNSQHSSTDTFETKPHDDICKPFGDSSNFTSGAQSSTLGTVAADSGTKFTFGDRPHANRKPRQTTTSTPKIIFGAGNSSTIREKSPFANSAFEGGTLTSLSFETPWTNSLSTTATKKPALAFGAQPAILAGFAIDSTLKNGSSTDTFKTKPHDDICKPFGDSSNFTSGVQSSTLGTVAADSGTKFTFGDRPHPNREARQTTTSTPKIIFGAGNSSTIREKTPFANSAFEGGTSTSLSFQTPWTNSISTTANKKPASAFGAPPAIPVGFTIDSTLKNGSSTDIFKTKPHDDICKPFGDSSNFTSGAQSSTLGTVAADSGTKFTFGDRPHPNTEPRPTTTSTPKIIFGAGNSSTIREKSPFASSAFEGGALTPLSLTSPSTNSFSTTATKKPALAFGAPPAVSVGFTIDSTLKNGSSTDTFKIKHHDDIWKPFGDSSNFTSGAQSSTLGTVAADSGTKFTFGDRPHPNREPRQTTTSTPKIIFGAGNSSTIREKSPFANSAFDGGTLTSLSFETPWTNSLSTTATKKPALAFGAPPAVSVGFTIDSTLKNGSSTDTFKTKPHDDICKPFGDSSNFTSGAQSSTLGTVAADSGTNLTFDDWPHRNKEPRQTTSSTPKIMFGGGNSSTIREKSPFTNSAFESGSLTSLSLTSPSTKSFSTTAIKKPALAFGAPPAVSGGLTIDSTLKNGSSTDTFKIKHHDDIWKPFGDSFNSTSGTQSSTFGTEAAYGGTKLTFGDRSHRNMKPWPTTTSTPKIIFGAGNSSTIREKSPFASSAFEGGALTPLSLTSTSTNSFNTTATKKPALAFGAQPSVSVGLTIDSTLKNEPCPTTPSPILQFGEGNSSTTQTRTPFPLPQPRQTATAKLTTTASTMLPADSFDAQSKMLTNLRIGETSDNVDRARPVKLIQKEQKEKNVELASECSVCLQEDIITHIFIPCGHNVFCGDCALKLYAQDDPRCPICRGVIERYIRSYNTA